MDRCPVRKLLLLTAVMAMAQSPTYQIGRPATPEEIRHWDISIRPDGKGLPPGSGTVTAGKEIYANRCARCHGAEGQGSEGFPLVGGVGTLSGPKPLKTVASYWPYAPTIFDYVRRAMPFDNPGTLSEDQVYSVTGYVLYLGGVVPAGAVIDAHSLPNVRMPNRNGFVPDPRPDTK